MIPADIQNKYYLLGTVNNKVLPLDQLNPSFSTSRPMASASFRRLSPFSLSDAIRVEAPNFDNFSSEICSLLGLTTP